MRILVVCKTGGSIVGGVWIVLIPAGALASSPEPAQREDWGLNICQMDEQMTCNRRAPRPTRCLSLLSLARWTEIISRKDSICPTPA